MKAGVYCRISRDKDDTQAGVDRQREDCKVIAEERGWQVVDTYIDNNTSAFDRSIDRPEFQRLMQDVEAGNIEAVVVYDTDRLYRQQREARLLLNQVDDYGFRSFIIASETGDYNLANKDEADAFSNNVQSAEKYSRQISRKVARKNLSRASQGKPRRTHDRPFGYRWTEDNGLEIEPQEAKLIQEAASRILSGDTLGGITNDWNKRGITTSRNNPWGPRSLKVLLTAPRVAGLIQYFSKEARTQRFKEAKRNGGRIEISAKARLLKDRDGIPVKGQWEAIVTEDVWERLVTKLENPARRNVFNQGMRIYLLTGGMSVCDVCGGSLQAHKSKDGTRLYRCNNNIGTATERKGCKVTMQADPLEDFVKEAVIHALAGDALERLLQAATKHEEKERKLVTDLHKLEADKERLVDLLTEGVLNATEYRPRRQRVDNEIEAIQRKLRSNGKTRIVAELPKSEEALREAWDSRGMDWRRTLIATVLDRVVVKPKRQFDPAFDAAKVELVWKV